MAADNRLHAFQIARNIPGIMCHQEGNTCDGEAQDAGQVAQVVLPEIVVAPDRIDVSVQAQLVQVAFADDVSRVQNMGAALQFGDDLTPKQPVGIGQDRDPYGVRIPLMCFHVLRLLSGPVPGLFPDYTGKHTGL